MSGGSGEVRVRQASTQRCQLVKGATSLHLQQVGRLSPIPEKNSTGKPIMIAGVVATENPAATREYWDQRSDIL